MTPETLKWFNSLPPEQRIPTETDLRPEQAFPTERSGCVPGCTMRPGHTPPCCTCGPGSATCKRGCPDYRGGATTERAFLGNPVRTSAVVRDEAIRAAVTEALAPLTRDLGLAVEALAARHPLPVRTYAPGWVVIWTDPDTRERSLDTSTLFHTEDEARAHAARYDAANITVHRLGGAE